VLTAAFALLAAIMLQVVMLTVFWHCYLRRDRVAPTSRASRDGTRGETPAIPPAVRFLTKLRTPKSPIEHELVMWDDPWLKCSQQRPSLGSKGWAQALSAAQPLADGTSTSASKATSVLGRKHWAKVKASRSAVTKVAPSAAPGLLDVTSTGTREVESATEKGSSQGIVQWDSPWLTGSRHRPPTAKRSLAWRKAKAAIKAHVAIQDVAAPEPVKSAGGDTSYDKGLQEVKPVDTTKSDAGAAALAVLGRSCRVHFEDDDDTPGELAHRPPTTGDPAAETSTIRNVLEQPAPPTPLEKSGSVDRTAVTRYIQVQVLEGMTAAQIRDLKAELVDVKERAERERIEARQLLAAAQAYNKSAAKVLSSKRIQALLISTERVPMEPALPPATPVAPVSSNSSNSPSSTMRARQVRAAIQDNHDNDPPLTTPPTTHSA
jgi:hypothetical protein